jgi:hypothetical protein
MTVTQKSWLSEFGARSDENKRVGDLTTCLLQARGECSLSDGFALL